MVNFPYPHNQRERGVKCRLSYSLCDKFNLYNTDQSLCPLWFVPFARQQECILEYIITHQTQESTMPATNKGK
jgi:hypothetical protein